MREGILTTENIINTVKPIALKYGVEEIYLFGSYARGCMKYSDEQRIKKILEYAKKQEEYISNNKITKEDLINEYSLQWRVTTPLYNIG